jgi:hypothetical protein
MRRIVKLFYLAFMAVVYLRAANAHGYPGKAESKVGDL